MKDIIIFNSSHTTTELLEVFYQLLSDKIKNFNIKKVNDIFPIDNNALYIIINSAGYGNRKLKDNEKPIYYITYQMEPLSENNLPSDEYITFLRDALHVWDYNFKNIYFLKKYNVNNISYLPIGYHESLSHNSDEKNVKDIDVLFLGWDKSERRQNVKNLLIKENIKCVFTNSLNHDGMKKIISHSKICINIHFRDKTFLETPRLSILLSSKAFIISEISEDEKLDKEYGKNGIIFCKYDDLIDVIKNYLKYDGVRDFLSKKSNEWYSTEMKLENLYDIKTSINKYFK
uniref:Uncharacterized protein n=1 Tax=Pithovirus LCPAC104 TaxID=2506589 RepID=A0A481Z650_9VIRU|nr:MAG: hypothetical protein LCPAC104_00560 [Pithovirus LCPAC104]